MRYSEAFLVIHTAQDCLDISDDLQYEEALYMRRLAGGQLANLPAHGGMLQRDGASAAEDDLYEANKPKS